MAIRKRSSWRCLWLPMVGEKLHAGLCSNVKEVALGSHFEGAALWILGLQNGEVLKHGEEQAMITTQRDAITPA